MKTNSAYLHHILDAIAQIQEYTHGYTQESFLGDDKTIDATLMQLEVIAECSNKLTKEFKDGHPEIPFRFIIDMRNVAVHDYFGVIRKTVWETCQDDLPPLKQTILIILEEENNKAA